MFSHSVLIVRSLWAGYRGDQSSQNIGGICACHMKDEAQLKAANKRGGEVEKCFIATAETTAGIFL